MLDEEETAERQVEIENAIEELLHHEAEGERARKGARKGKPISVVPFAAVLSEIYFMDEYFNLRYIRKSLFEYYVTLQDKSKKRSK